MRKTCVELNRPIITGFTILELSKLLMYELHYNFFKNIYHEKCSLIYTDTDSLIYEIYTKDLYNDMKNFENILDLSNYSEKHEIFSNRNNKKLGYLKDESGGKIITQFIGLKPKLYSIQYYENQSISKCKGLQYAVLKKYIEHKFYENVLKNDNIMCSNTRRIQSQLFNIKTIEMSKISLSPLDDKRYILSNKIDTLPFGYLKI